MNRSRRVPQNKQFVSGGVYDARQSFGGTQQDNPGNQGFQANQGNHGNQRSQKNQGVSSGGGQQQQNTNGQNNVAQTAPLQPPPPLPPQIKHEQQRMDDAEQMADSGQQQLDNNKVNETNLFDESGKLQYKYIFRTRKKSSVRNKEKRVRVNRQLRKTLIPKNALMALHEVAGLTISEFTIDNSATGGFIASVTVNDKQYEGKGSSKMSAKNNASEKALRDYILEKMREKPRPGKNSTNNADEAMDTNEGNDEHENGETTGVIDDVPMANLASFAIYKLFMEWESAGFEVPELHLANPANGSDAGSTGESSPEAKTAKPPSIRNELPNNWESIHPTTLLCMMRPGLQYREQGTVGEPPNVLQRMGVTVDDTEYLSSGRSKKIARRNVAVTVLNDIFGTNFVKEQPCED